MWVCRRWVSFPTQNKTCPTTILPFVFTGNVPGDCQSQGLSKDVLSPSSPAVPDLCSSRLQSLPSSTTYIPQLVSVRGGFVTHCHGTSPKHQVLGSTLCSQPAEFNKESQPKFRKSHKCRFNSTHRTYLQEINEINHTMKVSKCALLCGGLQVHSSLTRIKPFPVLHFLRCSGTSLRDSISF